MMTDLGALIESSGNPLRKSMRVNTLKCTTDEFKAWAKAKEWMIESVPWCKEGFFVDRVNRDEALGKDLMHVLGYVYMQEAASMLPVVLLDPKPGDKVLDMSAAPGSKTTQIGAAMQGRGVLIASDVQEKRLWALLTNLQRCGVSDVLVTRKVGQWFAGNMTETFDRVLCDAPCTAQGTVRKDSSALEYCSIDNIGKMARLQRELLEAAVHATKVGGRIVYSTCTLTPEENEAVVASILAKFPGRLKVLDPKELGLDLKQGVADSIKAQYFLKGQGSTLNEELPCVRLWPQTYDTEGFFSVAIEKTSSTRAQKYIEEPHRYEIISKAKVAEMADRLVDWYGYSFIGEHEALITQRDQICIIPQEALEFRLPMMPYFTGLPFGKFTDHGLPRLSHEIATLRGNLATKQILKLADADLKSAMKGVNITSVGSGNDDGDVMLAFQENALGRPIIFGRGMLKNGIVLNRLPRDMVRMFA